MLEKKFHHIKPEEQYNEKLKEFGNHSLELNIDGNDVGRLDYSYFSKIIPSYYIDNVSVSPEYQGMGYGSEMMNKINNFLKDKKRMGVLINTIGESESKNKREIYKRHGWQEWDKIKGNTYTVLYFNPPKWSTNKEIDETIEKIMGRPMELVNRKSKKMKNRKQHHEIW